MKRFLGLILGWYPRRYAPANVGRSMDVTGVL